VSREPSTRLRQGRRDLEGILGVELLEDLTWNEEVGKWTIRVRLTREGPESRHVPRETDWYILLADDYPWGKLKFCPAKQGCITSTFNHQEYNRPWTDGRPWTTGELCLNTTVNILGRHGLEDEPFQASGRHGRLRWHVLRALDWLNLAATGELVKVGDPFEIPHFPGATLADTTVAFAEGAASFNVWESTAMTYGTVNLMPLAAKPSIHAVTGFYTLPGLPVMEHQWGHGTLLGSTPTRGVWLRLSIPLAIEPWQAPATWGELCRTCRAGKVDLDRVLLRLFRTIRDGQQHLMLVGFPMPERIGGKNSRMHWQPIRLPILTQEYVALRGFRPGRESARYYLDRTKALAGTAELEWLSSENWDPGQLVSRGSVSANLASSHVLLLGGGALGSVVGELLIRAGVRRLTIVDDELLQVGNLCRHTLVLSNVKSAKAEALASHLRNISPHVEVDFLAEEFPPPVKARDALARCDVVIDCTADDAVIHHLSQFPWNDQKRFVSLSLGHAARRLYCFFSDGAAFPENEFRIALLPWLRKDREEVGDAELPREGVGCWHPVFPARADDVWMMASIAVKHLEERLKAVAAINELTVFEQRFNGSAFSGVVRVPSEADNG
jgi:molybdopterin/thiamine biosynthesis adenylyltransferase